MPGTGLWQAMCLVSHTLAKIKTYDTRKVDQGMPDEIDSAHTVKLCG